MKQVILPTDFTICSLQPVHEVMRYCTDPVCITLLHLLEMPGSTGELLFRLRPDKKITIPEEFHRACEVMSNTYEDRLFGLKPLIRYGNTVPLVENLLRGLRADLVFVQLGDRFEPPHPSSVNAAELLRRCHVPVVTVDVPPSLTNTSIGGLLLSKEL